jgi:hypothetical protein
MAGRELVPPAAPDRALVTVKDNAWTRRYAPLPACIGNAFLYNLFGQIVVLNENGQNTRNHGISNTNHRALEQERAM